MDSALIQTCLVFCHRSPTRAQSVLFTMLTHTGFVLDTSLLACADLIHPIRHSHDPPCHSLCSTTGNLSPMTIPCTQAASAASSSSPPNLPKGARAGPSTAQLAPSTPQQPPHKPGLTPEALASLRQTYNMSDSTFRTLDAKVQRSGAQPLLIKQM